jgi:DNA-binding MarR family transcriptional regulator
VVPTDHHRRVLQALRRIMRQVEISSRSLELQHGVTAPQLICLAAIVDAGSTTQIELSELVHLTPSTLFGVLHRLQTKRLIRRSRDHRDRRCINVQATRPGIDLVRQAPPPLQDTLLHGMHGLTGLELVTLTAALDRLVSLLEADGIHAAPILAPGRIPQAEV